MADFFGLDTKDKLISRSEIVRRSRRFCEAKRPAELEHEECAASVGDARQIRERRVSAHQQAKEKKRTCHGSFLFWS